MVQHMPKDFTRSFAERLNSLFPVPVKEAENGDLVRNGQVLVAPEITIYVSTLNAASS